MCVLVNGLTIIIPQIKSLVIDSGFMYFYVLYLPQLNMQLAEYQLTKKRSKILYICSIMGNILLSKNQLTI